MAAKGSTAVEGNTVVEGNPVVVEGDEDIVIESKEAE